ncbi:MAG: hypothetical protein VB071_08950 [Lawsonibacter sp.]|nr:hypothetical protein [Lawsonibacter sp.]
MQYLSKRDAALCAAVLVLTVLSAYGADLVSQPPAKEKDAPVALCAAYAAPEVLADNVPQEAAPTEDGAAECLAKMLYGEARGCSKTEQAGAVWCVLNRVDDPKYPDGVVAVVTQKNQFYGYKADNPVLPELLALAEDVLARWYAEGDCIGNVGRVLPKEYLYFTGDGRRNQFRTEYKGGETWDWSLASPYEE